jgi:hypothetical protein
MFLFRRTSISAVNKRLQLNQQGGGISYTSGKATQATEVLESETAQDGYCSKKWQRKNEDSGASIHRASRRKEEAPANKRA